MPARKDRQSTGVSPIAHLRTSRGLTQKELADAVGLSVRTLARLEHEEVEDPPVGWFVNLSIALGVEPSDLLGDAELQWKTYSEKTATPPPEDWIAEARLRRGLSPTPPEWKREKWASGEEP